MTIQHERMGEDQAEQGDDRREPTTRTRISWAAERPYVVPAAVDDTKAGRELDPKALPELPEGLEFRFVDRYLTLRDAETGEPRVPRPK